MFSYSVDNIQGRPVARLVGDLTLEHSRDILSELLTSLSEHSDITIDLGESTKSDLSFFLILYALLKHPTANIGFARLPRHLFDNAQNLGADDLMKELSTRVEKNA